MGGGRWRRRMLSVTKAIDTPGLGFERVNRERFITAATRMHHMVATPADGLSIPGIDQIEYGMAKKDGNGISIIGQTKEYYR